MSAVGHVRLPAACARPRVFVLFGFDVFVCAVPPRRRKINSFAGMATFMMVFVPFFTFEQAMEVFPELDATVSSLFMRGAGDRRAHFMQDAWSGSRARRTGWTVSSTPAPGSSVASPRMTLRSRR